MSTQEKFVTLRMPGETLAQVESRRKKLGMSKNAFILTIVEAFLSNPKSQDKLLVSKAEREKELKRLNRMISKKE